MTTLVHFFTPFDLHAYIDGVQDDYERRAFVGFLSDTPEACAEIQAYEHQNRMLKRLARAKGL